MTMNAQPQIIITLDSDGRLIANLPSHSATLRKVPLREGAEGPSLRRMFEAQARGELQIGEDGAPTQAQVRHWEEHKEAQPDRRCRFCAEAGWLADGANSRRAMREIIANASGGGVIVRRITARVSGGAPAKPTTVNVEDLGF